MPLGPSEEQAFSAQDYEAFRAFLEDACGILLGENKQYLVRARLKKIMAEQGMASLSELVEKMRRAPRSGLREAVIDAMTTNETLWFRDNHPFDYLQGVLFPELAKRAGDSPLRIWSAACSSGQEPYSIAMSAQIYRQNKPWAFPQGVKIVGTDISSSMLEQAREGCYEHLALGRGLSNERLYRFFQEDRAFGGWRVKPEIREMVEFRLMNLIDNFSTLGRFDIILCRNVLIYFSAERKKDILARLHTSLKPQGYLFLGASESMSGLSEAYEMVQYPQGIVYRAKSPGGL